MWSSGQYPNAYAGGNMQGQFMQPQAFNVQQAGMQAQYQNVLQGQYQTVQMQMPVQEMQLIQEPMQEMQLMQMPIQEMQIVQEVQVVQMPQEMQVVQMPVQEVQMVPMQVPVQQMVWVPNPPPPPLLHKSETPEPEPVPKRERAAPPPPPEWERERERAPPPPPPEEPLIIYVERDKVKIVEVPYDQVCIHVISLQPDLTPRLRQIVEVEVPVEVIKKVQKRVEIPVEKLVCNNIKTVQKRVEVERCVWKEVPVEKVVEIKVAAVHPSPSPPQFISRQAGATIKPPPPALPIYPPNTTSGSSITHWHWHSPVRGDSQPLPHRLR
jgi:hypothetical protein